MRFEGKALFCTGGGSGIGAAVCRRFASEGGRVAVVDIDGGKAEAVAASIPGALAVTADVSEESSVRDAVRTARSELGSIDCVYNGAGNLINGLIADSDVADFRRLLDVHAVGTFLVCRETIPALREAGAGS